jgi:hypothetical protein
MCYVLWYYMELLYVHSRYMGATCTEYITKSTTKRAHSFNAEENTHTASLALSLAVPSAPHA